VRALPFLDLVKGQFGPDHTIPAARIRDLNRSIKGHIEVVARRQGEGETGPADSSPQESPPPR